MNSSDFGGLVRTYRQKNGFKLREFAKAWNISAQYLCDLEYGRRSPTNELIDKFESFTGFDVPIEVRVDIMLTPGRIGGTIDLFPDIKELLRQKATEYLKEKK